MKIAVSLTLSLLLPAATALAGAKVSIVEGDYLEVRTCDVYTGPCFANAEVNEVGKEATLAWKFRVGELDGVDLRGRSVVAVVEASATLGDPFANPTPSRSVLYFDEGADLAQRDALKRFALDRLGDLAGEFTERVLSIELAVGCCDELGCAELSVGDEVSVKTRCLCDDDIHCGNESIYYPPLTGDVDVIPAVATDHTVKTTALARRWSDTECRGAFTGTFRAAMPAQAERPIIEVSAAPRAPEKFSLVEIAGESGGDDARVPELPSEIPAAFAELLDPTGLRLLTKRGEPLYDIWFRRELPLGDEPTPGMRIKFPLIPVGSLIGAVQAHGGEYDYRESEIDKGFYALRYAVQPEDGDHLGTSDTRDYLLLTGFEDDTDPAPITDDDELSEQSILASSSDHPLIWYLIEPARTDATAPHLYEHDEREEWVADVGLNVRAPNAEESKVLRVGVVLIGIAEEF